MTFTDEEFSKFSEILESLGIRHPNPSPSDQKYVTLKEGISKGILQQFFRSQYHKDNVVEFIPRYIRPMINHPVEFYKTEARPTERHPEEKSKKPVQTAGFEHELLVQKKFESLGSSNFFSENKITIFHNMKKDFLKYNKLKKANLMNNEYDLVVFDAMHGVFLVETKKREHANFKGDSLKTELDRQQERMKFMCLIKKFLGVKTPITPVILTSVTEKPNKDHLVPYGNSYVLGVNFGENFEKTWKFFLKSLTLATVSPDDIEKFAVTLNTLLRFGDTPFHLHKNLTGGSITTPGIYQQTKKKNIVIWTKQQSEIIDLIQDTLSENAKEFAAGPCQTTLKLVISGCYGSGKTLMLYEAAKLFCRENKEQSVEKDARRVAYVIYDRKDEFYKEGNMSLLHKRLEASFEDEKLTKGRVSVVNLAGYKQSNICCLVGYVQSLGTVDLILIDEFLLFNEHLSDKRQRLICDDHSMTNVIFTTLDNTDYDKLWKEVFEDFKILQLNGNLRSCPSICNYILANPGASSSGEVGYNPQRVVPLTVDHNVTGGIVEVINLESNADLSQVTDKIKSILKTEEKETEKKETEKKDNIFVINNKSRKSIDNELVPKLKKLGVEYGDFKKFIGCEAATVIYIGREIHDIDRGEALSRATVNLILFLYPG